MTHEEQLAKAIFALNIIHDRLSDHGTNLTQSEVNDLLHGITKTLIDLTYDEWKEI